MTHCEHLADGHCRLASAIAGVPVATAPDACGACENERHPRDANRVTCGLAVQATRTNPTRHAEVVRTVRHLLEDGAGTELHRLAASYGISPTVGCRCFETAAEMNARGIPWCKEHRGEIVAAMEADARRRGFAVWLLSLGGARWLLERAIHLAEHPPVSVGAGEAVEAALREAVGRAFPMRTVLDQHGPEWLAASRQTVESWLDHAAADLGYAEQLAAAGGSIRVVDAALERLRPARPSPWVRWAVRKVAGGCRGC